MKTVLITGANSGLGFETAKKIAKDPEYKVILACRNMEKAEAAKAEIIADTKNENIETIQMDTSSLDSVREAAKKIVDSGETIYALVNNAGVSSMGHSGTTEDGFDIVFETNYLGHFLLTQMLLPVMADDGRILSTSSDMHNPPRGIKWPGAEGAAHPEQNDHGTYSYSKLALIYMTHELDIKLREEGKHIAVNTFNPGFMSDTNFSSGGKAAAFMVKTTMPDRFGDLKTSSDAYAKLVTEAEFGEISGEYFDRSTETAKSSELSYSKENAEELWDASMKFAGLA